MEISKTNYSIVVINDYQFSQSETIILVLLCSIIIVVAIISNTIVCILLSVRFCHSSHAIQFLRNFCFSCFGLCYLSSGKHQSGNHATLHKIHSNYITPNQEGILLHSTCTNSRSLVTQLINKKDPWIEDCPSSHHECSCGKTSIAQQPSRYVFVKSSLNKTQLDYPNNGTIALNHNHLMYYIHADQVKFKKSLVIVSGIRSNSVTSYFLFNLSLADILTAVLCVPIYVISDIIYIYWPLGEPLCKLVPYAQGVSVFVSALTHVVISWNRFILVFFPLRPRMSNRKAMNYILGLWILALIIPLPVPIVNKTIMRDNRTMCVEDWSLLIPRVGSINSDYMNEIHTTFNSKSVIIKVDVVYTIILMILQYFLPLGMICGTYVAIGFKIKRLKPPGERDNARDQKLVRVKRRMVKMLTLVALMYGISHLPRHAIYLHGLIYPNFWYQHYSLRLWAAANFIRDTATCYNPFIYAWINRNFRQDLYCLLQSCLSLCSKMGRCFKLR